MGCIYTVNLPLCLYKEVLIDMKDGNEFGIYIKGLRRQMGLSIQEIAINSGISISYLSRLEKGLRKNPSGDVMIKLLLALNIEIQELLKILKIDYVDNFQTVVQIVLNFYLTKCHSKIDSRKALMLIGIMDSILANDWNDKSQKEVAILKIVSIIRNYE